MKFHNLHGHFSILNQFSHDLCGHFLCALYYDIIIDMIYIDIFYVLFSCYLIIYGLNCSIFNFSYACLVKICVSFSGPGHFRQLNVGGDLGQLIVSSLGIGTFGGSEYEEVDKEYVKLLIRGFNLGINVIDT